MNSPSQPAGTGGSYWPMLLVLLVGQFMALMDVTITNVAVPAIGTDLDASGASLQLVVGGYTVFYAMLLITGARLGDLFGRRSMYLTGMLLFTAASLLCGIALSTPMLVVARLLQGAGAAVMVPQIMSVIQMRFTGRARAKALSGYGAALALGSIAGLMLGGVLVDADLGGVGWRAVFLVNVPLGVTLALLVPKVVPADAPRRSRSLDYRGLVLSMASIMLVVLPLVLGHETGWPPLGFAAMAAGVVLAAVFVAVERRVAARGGDPLLKLDVLRAPGMSAGLLTLICAMAPYGGFLFVFTIHLQTGLDEDPLRAGLTWVPMAAAFGIVGYHWRRLPERLHPLLAPAGALTTLVAYPAIALGAADGRQDDPVMWIGLVLMGAGLGAGLSPLMVQALVHVPMSKAPDAGGLLTTVMQLGQLIGVAAVGSLYFSVLDGRGAIPSSDALATTSYWVIGLVTVGLAAALFLARTVVRAGRAAAVGEPSAPEPAGR